MAGLGPAIHVLCGYNHEAREGMDTRPVAGGDEPGYVCPGRSL